MTNINNTESVIKVGTFFSGIGAPEKALQKLKEEKYIKDYKVEFFSEIDKNAIKSYCAIHNISEELNLGDITKIKGIDLSYCDLWMGGFPCQDISCAGKMRGFNLDSSTRSSLGWEMIRLLKEVKEKPKYVIFENVKMITSKKFRNTLKLFKEDLIKLGYTLYDNLLSATDYGIPQTRVRYFLIAILGEDNSFEFPEKIKLDKCANDLLDEVVDEKYFLSTSEYDVIGENLLEFSNKKKDSIKYHIDTKKLQNGGVCGYDKHTKFEISSRIFSTKGNIPTLTAANTTDNCKIVEEREMIGCV